ncbi:MAG: CDP-glycerol glycerophosphotransferase family protein, partial [Eubacterium sp.]|nr:CDP-glycerol glycerophosphotransferase family protein [Eubacterium sp.]
IVKTTDEVIDDIKSIDFANFDFAKSYPNFRKKFNYLDDGTASKRVAEAVIEEI